MESIGFTILCTTNMAHELFEREERARQKGDVKNVSKYEDFGRQLNFYSTNTRYGKLGFPIGKNHML